MENGQFPISEILVQYTYWLHGRGVLRDGLPYGTYSDLATGFARFRNLL